MSFKTVREKNMVGQLKWFIYKRVFNTWIIASARQFDTKPEAHRFISDNFVLPEEKHSAEMDF